MSFFHLFAFNDYDCAGGMRDYKGAFDTLEEAKQKILALDRYEADYAQIAAPDGSGSLTILSEYVISQQVLKDDGHPVVLSEAPVRWIDVTTYANLSDDVTLRTNLTPEQFEREPGTKFNPLPVPPEILNGTSAWRGLFKDDLFWNRDDGKYYKYPSGNSTDA